MPRKPQEIPNQKEEEKQSNNNQKYRYINRKENKLPSRENHNNLYENNQIQKNNYPNEKINIKKRSFINDSKKNNHINNIKNDDDLKENEENENENLNNENLIDSETFIVDDETSIEKPPNAIEINDLLGEKCKIELDILSINFTNFEQSKTSSKSMGVVKAYGANTYQGLVRNYNEDRVSIIINMAKPKNYQKKYWPKTSFFGIYDGHGGSMCAEFLRDCLHKLILNDINFPENVELAIRNGFFNAEKNFLNEIAIDPNDNNIISDRSGSCAVVVLVVDKKIYVANVGDSRALFSEKKGTNFVVVTDDHKPNNINEKNRIIKNGGHVYQSRTVISGAENENLNGQILFGPYRVLPGRLSVSRTIGDIEAKSEIFGGNPNVIIWEPDIFVYDLNKTDIDFFIMGCDGIFDQMSNQEVMECAWMILNNDTNNNKENEGDNDEESFEYNFENVNIHEKCGLIVDFIIKSSMVRKSFDNVTCLMIAFNDYSIKEKEEKTLNSISTEEYLKNIYRLNNSVNNQVSQPNKKSNKIINNMDNQRRIENENNIYNSGIISNQHNKNLNNKINTNNNAKDMPKNFLKPNLKLTNFINTKTNNLPNNSNDFLPRTYRNTDSSIVAKKNYNVNTTKSINNNKVYIKKRKERNPPKKSVNKTDISNNEESLSNSNIVTKKIMNKIDIQQGRRSTANNISIQRLSNNHPGRKKRINTGNNINNNKLDASQSQNELSNNIYSPNKSKNESNINNINNNIIQKLKQNKISKMPLELNNKLINSNNTINNNLNVHFYYSNTYSTKYKKLPYLKTNSISNIPSLTTNMNHLTTTNVTLNSINAQLHPKKIKNLTKPKTFRYNNTSVNKYRKTFYKNNFFGNGNKAPYNHYSHNINNLSNNNNINSNHNNIIYSQNFNVKIKTKKSRDTMTSRKKKNSFHKVIKSLGLNSKNVVKNKVKQLSSKKISYSKEKDIKNFLYKNKTNIVSGKNDNIINNKKSQKKNNYKDNNKY